MGPVSPGPSVAGLQALKSAHLGPASVAPPPSFFQTLTNIYLFILEKEMATQSSIRAWRIPWAAWRATAHGIAESDTTEET